MWETIASILGGGLTGLIGTCVSSLVSYKTKKMELDHQIKMIEAETGAMKAETEANIKITHAQTEADIQKAEMQAFETSMQLGSKDYTKEGYIADLMKHKYLKWIGALLITLFAIVDFLKGLARPAITYYMIGLSTYLTVVVYRIIQTTGAEAIPISEALPIFKYIINSLLFITTTVILWWFGERRVGKTFGEK